MKVLIVIDMQNDFIGGPLGTPEATVLVDKVAERIETSEGELILFTRDTHQEDYLTTPEGKKLPVVHCLEDSSGWQIHEKVFDAWRNNKSTIKLDDVFENTFNKAVFGSVDLVSYLDTHKDEIDEIELVGVCTDICVVSNALMIKNTMPDIPLSVNAALCAGVTPESHEQALSTMKMCQVDII
jgi:nicotinamidase-related amidase